MSIPEERYERRPDDRRPVSGDGSRQVGGSGFSGDRAEPRMDGGSEEKLANALGWLSLGLGLAGLAAPGEVARLIGVRNDERNREVLRTVGVREIISGIGILAQPRPAPWLWTRVAGDMMDLALLARALGSEPEEKERLAATTAVIAGVTAVDLYCSQQLSRSANGTSEQEGQHEGAHRVRVVTINKPAEEVYQFWRNLENLPRFMANLESVQILDERRSRWRAKGPAGATVEWEAETTEDRPNELIAWQSLPGSDVQSRGRVTFCEAPGGRGTEVKVEMEYTPPAGMLGEKVAALFGKDPKQTLREDLRRLKQVLETGEVVISEGALYGPTFPQRAAKPPSDEDLAKVQLRAA